MRLSWFRYRPFLVSGAFILLALVVWLALMSEFRLDDSFITYRYARNLAHGLGLVYNAGDSVLSTTAPLYSMLLAALSFIIPDFHFLGSLVGSLSIGFGAWLIYELLPRQIPTTLRLWGGLVYALGSPLWLALGMETALWIGLVLGAVYSAHRGRWGLAGLLAAFGVLTRPDAALPAVLLGFAALVTTVNQIATLRRWWQPLVRYSLLGLIPIIVFVLWAGAVYGSPFPATLTAKSAQAALGITGLGVNVDAWQGLTLIIRSLMSQSSLYIVLGLLLLFGLAGSLNTTVLVVVLWGALHLAAYILIKVAPYRWYYAALLPGLVLLATVGLYFIQRRIEARGFGFARYLIAAIAVFPLLAEASSFARIRDMMQNGGPNEVMLPIVDWRAYRETGEWLNANTPPDATVGVAEVGQVGFYAQRWMTDYLGLLQPDVSAMLRRGDLYSWLAGYAPDYLVFQRFRGAALVLYNYVIEADPWFRANYKQAAEFDDPRYNAGPVTIFQRTEALRPLNAQAVQADDYDGLRLTGLATDADSLTDAGGAVRVRLDWQVIGALPPDIHIAVKGLELAEGNPGFDGDYHTTTWRGEFSTWHGFVVPPGAKPGRYILLVAVGPQGGPYHEQGVGALEITSS